MPKPEKGPKKTSKQSDKKPKNSKLNSASHSQPSSTQASKNPNLSTAHAAFTHSAATTVHPVTTSASDAPDLTQGISNPSAMPPASGTSDPSLAVNSYQPNTQGSPTQQPSSPSAQTTTTTSSTAPKKTDQPSGHTQPSPFANASHQLGQQQSNMNIGQDHSPSPPQVPLFNSQKQSHKAHQPPNPSNTQTAGPSNIHQPATTPKNTLTLPVQYSQKQWEAVREVLDKKYKIVKENKEEKRIMLQDGNIEVAHTKNNGIQVSSKPTDNNQVNFKKMIEVFRDSGSALDPNTPLICKIEGGGFEDPDNVRRFLLDLKDDDKNNVSNSRKIDVVIIKVEMLNKMKKCADDPKHPNSHSFREALAIYEEFQPKSKNVKKLGF